MVLWRSFRISTECLPNYHVGYIHKKYKSAIMKRMLFSAIIFTSSITGIAVAQDLKEKDVPPAVKSAFAKKYPYANKISWEKEKGNFEANWGGKSGEDSSALFTPSANFVEIVVSIPINQLPASVAPYVNKNYNGAKIKEAGKITDASGKHMFEVEIKGKDLIFDEKGVFIKED
jgi:hypothetical protein